VQVARGLALLVVQRHLDLVLAAAVQQVGEGAGAAGQEAVGQDAYRLHQPHPQLRGLLAGQGRRQQQLEGLVPHLCGEGALRPCFR
jgi:hypothetical protein